MMFKVEHLQYLLFRYKNINLFYCLLYSGGTHSRSRRQFPRSQNTHDRGCRRYAHLIVGTDKENYDFLCMHNLFQFWIFLFYTWVLFVHMRAATFISCIKQKLSVFQNKYGQIILILQRSAFWYQSCAVLLCDWILENQPKCHTRPIPLIALAISCQQLLQCRTS